MTPTRRQIQQRTLQGDNDTGLGTFGKVIVGAGIAAVAISIGLFFLAQHTRVIRTD